VFSFSAPKPAPPPAVVVPIPAPAPVVVAPQKVRFHRPPSRTTLLPALHYTVNAVSSTSTSTSTRHGFTLVAMAYACSWRHGGHAGLRFDVGMSGWYYTTHVWRCFKLVVSAGLHRR
jgi:hypothetical protein